jgi:DNA polymerase-4
LLAAAMPMIWDGGVTLIGLSLSNLDSSDTVQLQLPFTAADPVQLDVAVDAIRERYGSAAVVRGVLLGRDPGYSMPMLPDLP